MGQQDQKGLRTRRKYSVGLQNEVTIQEAHSLGLCVVHPG